MVNRFNRKVCGMKRDVLPSRSAAAVGGGRHVTHPGSTRYRLGEPLECVDCGQRADVYADGWRGYRTDESCRDELPALAFVCPRCVRREWIWRRHGFPVTALFGRFAPGRRGDKWQDEVAT